METIIYLIGLIGLLSLIGYLGSKISKGLAKKVIQNH